MSKDLSEKLCKGRKQFLAFSTLKHPNTCTNNADQSCFPSQSKALSSSFCNPAAKFGFQLQKLIYLKTAPTQQVTGRSDVILPQELVWGVWAKTPEGVWIPCPGGWKSAQGHRVSLKLCMELAGDGNTLLSPWDLGEVKPSSMCKWLCLSVSWPSSSECQRAERPQHRPSTARQAGKSPDVGHHLTFEYSCCYNTSHHTCAQALH